MREKFKRIRSDETRNFLFSRKLHVKLKEIKRSIQTETIKIV